MEKICCSLLLVLTVFMMLDVGSVSSLECYNCDSVSDSKCSEDWPWTNFFNSPETSSCDGSCVKAIVGAGDKSVTTRSCQPVCAEVSTSLSIIGGRGGIYCCSSDNCNSATAVKVNMFVTVLTFLAMLLLRNM